MLLEVRVTLFWESEWGTRFGGKNYRSVAQDHWFHYCAPINFFITMSLQTCPVVFNFSTNCAAPCLDYHSRNSKLTKIVLNITIGASNVSKWKIQQLKLGTRPWVAIILIWLIRWLQNPLSSLDKSLVYFFCMVRLPRITTSHIIDRCNQLMALAKNY